MANIFLLEDDKILSKGISIALKKDSHTITATYGFVDALTQYQKLKIDLFLLDINLPDGSGLELCRKIRETSDTPILFLTANDTEENMLEGFGAGCDDYISKPFSLEVLRKKVQSLLFYPLLPFYVRLFPYCPPWYIPICSRSQSSKFQVQQSRCRN